MRSLSVTYTGEPDVVYEFLADGQGYSFGRDSDACDIVIWSALEDQSLSRIAGRIWLMDGELWLRNLSGAHDLLIQVPGMPPEPYLPPRRAADDPGPARSLPPDTCVVLAPGGCELVVQQEAVCGSADPPQPDDDQATSRLPAPPEHLVEVARALCAPLLAGSRLPATYAQVAEALGLTSHKKVRTLVGELCEIYAEASPEMAEHIRARRAREESLVSASARHRPRLVGGVWRFEERPEEPDDDELERRRALMLPDYYEVAHLLVRHRVVRSE